MSDYDDCIDINEIDDMKFSTDDDDEEEVVSLVEEEVVEEEVESLVEEEIEFVEVTNHYSNIVPRHGYCSPGNEEAVPTHIENRSIDILSNGSISSIGEPELFDTTTNQIGDVGRGLPSIAEREPFHPTTNPQFGYVARGLPNYCSPCGSSISSQHDPDSDFSISLPPDTCNEEYIPPENTCHNCFRKNYHQNSSYLIELHTCQRKDIIKRYKFKFVHATKLEPKCNEEVKLCNECFTFLTTPTGNSCHTQQSWPSFVWYVLQDETVRSIYGCDVWKLIPKEWRYWWIDEVKRISDCYRNVSIEFPTSFFAERTADSLTWNTSIASGKLSKLMNVCNELLIPNVACPWGCTEYIHHVGSIDIDVIFQRYLRKVQLKLIGSDERLAKVEWIREDFLRENDDYDCWLLNSMWKVRPSLIITKFGAKLMTCRNHHGGTPKTFIHAPRSPNHILPSYCGDQICHAVLQPRSLKPMKASKYSDSFQLFEQRASFHGVDSSMLSRFGNYDIISIILDEHESRSICNRPDISSLLDINVGLKQIGSNIAASLKARASEKYPDPSYFDKYLHGSTYVPLEDSMAMHRDIGKECTRNFTWINDNITTCRQNFHSRIYTCQKLDIDRYGPSFATCPSFYHTRKSFDFRLTWIMCVLLTQVKELWIATNDIYMDQKKWHGWFLAYLTRKSFPTSSHRRTHKDCPYKMKFVNKPERLTDKLYGYNVISSLPEQFTDHEHVECFTTNDFIIEREVDDNTTVIIGHSINHDLHNYITQGEFTDEYMGIFHLRCVVTISCFEDLERHNMHQWNGTIFSRHNKSSKYWTQKRRKKYSLQLGSEIRIPIDESIITVVFVCTNITNIIEKRNAFLKYMGGQSHVLCHEHRYPLITSSCSTTTCSIDGCGNRDYLRCPDVYCSCAICKKCYEKMDRNEICAIGHGITMTDNMVEEIEEEKGCEDSTSSEDDYDEYNYDYDDDDDDDDDDVSNLDESDSDESVCHEPNENKSKQNTLLQDNGTTIEDSDNDLYDNYDDELHHPDNVDNSSIDSNDNEKNKEFSTEEFEDYLTSAQDVDVPLEEVGEDILTEDFPTTDAGQIAYTITEHGQSDKAFASVVNTRVIMNQMGACLSRSKSHIQGYRNHKNFVEKLASTILGKTIPAAYLEGMSFPSIFYKQVPDDGAIAGAIPTCLLNEGSTHGFASINEHMRIRLLSSGAATSTSPGYISFAYDTIINLATNHNDTRMVINRAVPEPVGQFGISLKDSNDGVLTDSIDSRRNVRNLCASQLYHHMHFFKTLTVNQRMHFGISPIKQWTDGDDWTKYFGWEDLTSERQEELKQAISQASATLTLRNWLEVRKLFVDWLIGSEDSPYAPVDAVFVRDEFQDKRGNLPHIHMLISIDFDKATSAQNDRINDLIRADIGSIVRSDEVQHLIDDGILKNYEDWNQLHVLSDEILPHRCTPRCQVRIAEGDGPNCFRCKSNNNLRLSPDITRDNLISLPLKLSSSCIERLIRCGLVDPIDDVTNFTEKEFKGHHPFLHPKKHVPKIHRTNNKNISPVEGYTYAACKSMQNVQCLIQCNGCCTYCHKYCIKVDKQNYVVALPGVEENTINLKSTFLHNTKISSSAINEAKAKAKRRDRKAPVGTAIGFLEMYMRAIGEKCVRSDLHYAEICTNTYANRSGYLKPPPPLPKVGEDTEDGVELGIIPQNIRNEQNFPSWRLFTDSQITILEGLKDSPLSVDKVTVFSVRPPELRHIFDQLGNYYRWFSIGRKLHTRSQLLPKFDINLTHCCWIDGLHRQVFLRKSAEKEVLDYLNTEKSINLDCDHIRDMVNFVKRIFELENMVNSNAILSDDEREERTWYSNNLLIEDKEKHLPIPVFSCIKPTMGFKFILHLLLSMGHFCSEYDLLRHRTLRESFKYAKLIGDSNEVEDLKQYSDNILKEYFIKQLCTYPNSQRVIGYWFVVAGELLDSVLIDNEMSIHDMPPSQQASLMESTDEKIQSYLTSMKKKLIATCKNELQSCNDLFNIPSIEALMQSSTEHPLEWNAFDCFKQSSLQSRASFEEQKDIVKYCVGVIDSYCCVESQNTFRKNCVLVGAPGSGKSFLMLSYLPLYAISKGLKVGSMTIMAARGIGVGGTHIHKMFCLPVNESYSIHRKAEKAISNLLHHPERLNFLQTTNILFFDEIGQFSTETMTTLDIIMRKIRSNNIYFGGVLLMATLDHRQLNPVKGTPFLMGSEIISCYDFLCLEHSIRASEDERFQRLQYLIRLHHSRYTKELLDEFQNLISEVCTFVPNWFDSRITPDTFRLFGKRSPAIEAAKQYVDQVKASLDVSEYKERIADDAQIPQHSREEWKEATDTTIAELDKKCREPQRLLFFKNAVYETTYNDLSHKEMFSHSQKAVLLDMPRQEDLISFRPIPIFVPPIGLKNVCFEPNKEKAAYIREGWKEVKISTAMERTQYIKNYIQARRKQYGLKHYFNSTIHASMGETLHKVAVEISDDGLWDKAQVVVACSRTKFGKNTIFVGEKRAIVNRLRQLIQQRNQYTDQMEAVLEVATVNTATTPLRQSHTFPFRIRDSQIPQCNTGFVYMLISLRNTKALYIGMTKCLRTRLKQHNSGSGSLFTSVESLRPYAIFSYICGFEGNRELMSQLEKSWKARRDFELNFNPLSCPKQIARSIGPTIQRSNRDGMYPHLRQVFLFDDNDYSL